MATASRYHDDESEDVGMMSDKPTRSTPPAASTNYSWWKYAAAGVLIAAAFVPAVGYTSSLLLEKRVNNAVEDALAKLPAQDKTSTPVTIDHKAEAAKVEDFPEGEHDLLLSNGTTIKIGNFKAGQRMEIKDCGTNADEARAKGCDYDVMMQEWTAPECIDWALSEKFLKQYNWTWYANGDASKTYDAVEVALGNHDVVYVDQSYHRAHCIFAWEKTVRALRTQRPMVSKLTDYDHVMHCKMNTLRTFEEGAEEVRGVVAPTVFTTCASLDVWLENLPENTHSSIDKLRKLI